MRLSPIALAAATLVATPAVAQQVKPIADARLRYEYVDQEGLAEDGALHAE